MLSTLTTSQRLGSLYERLFHDAVDPIVIEDLDGRIVDVNAAAVETFGWPREDLIGRPYTVLVPRDLCAEEATLRRRCAAGGRMRRARAVRVGKGGVPFEVSLSLSVLHGDDDLPSAIAAMTTLSAPPPSASQLSASQLSASQPSGSQLSGSQLSGSQQSAAGQFAAGESAAGESAASYPLAVDSKLTALAVWAESTVTGIFDVDLVAGRVYWSPELVALLGLPPDAAGPANANDVPDHVYPDDRARVDAAIRRSHDPASDGLFETEHRILRADGALRWLLVRGRTLFDGEPGARRPVRAVGVAYDVTVRKQAEEARLKALMDVSSHRAWACDADGRQFEDAPGWRALTGQSPYVWKRAGWIGAVHPSRRSAAAAAWREAVTRRTSYDGEWEVLDAHGDTRHMRIRAIPLVNDDDTVRSWAGIGEDITDRKRAELDAARAQERAREANALLDAIFAAAPIGLGFWDRDLRFRRINERLADMHGKSAAEHEGKRLDELLPDIEAPEELYLKWREVLATGEPWLGVEVRGETPARPGQQRTWKEDFFPVRVRGEIVGVAAVVQEITERRLAEAQLRESEARFRQLADNAPFMVWVTAPEGACIFLSRSWYEFTGVPPSEGLGSGWLDAVHPDDRPRFDQAFHDAQDCLQAFRVEFRLRRRDGEYRWVLQAAAPRFSQGSKFKGYIGSIIDITERKLAEQALEHADRRKDEFLAMLAHELRNPLAPLTTATELLGRVPSDSMLDELRRMIERQLNHLTRLVDDLLDTSRITTGRIILQRRHLDLCEVVRHSLETSRPLILSRGHEIALIEPERPLLVDADPVRLAQVITNLLNNSAKFTPPGGRIELGISTEGGAAVVTVRDSGVGIAPETLPHLFDRQKRIDEPHEDAGLGLGLSLVKRLVELHGGTVEARSAGVHCGATFVIRLPLVDTPIAAATVTAGPKLMDETPPSRRILIVDDNDDAAASLALLLSHAGHEVRDVRDAASALELVRSFVPDAVLLDIGLPDMDGWELARRLRAERCADELKLIAISGYGQRADRRRSRDAGIDHHLTKPVDYASIARCL